MVSFQKLAPSASGGNGFISTKELKQYAAVAIDYTMVQRGVTNTFKEQVNVVLGTFTCFNKDGDIVHEVGPGARWEASISKKGNSLTDQFPGESGSVLVRFYERQGSGAHAGKSFNQIEDVVDDDLVGKIVKTLESRGAAAVAEDDGPPAI